MHSKLYSIGSRHIGYLWLVLLASQALSAPLADENPLAVVQHFAEVLQSPNPQERQDATTALRVLAAEFWDEASCRAALMALFDIPPGTEAENDKAKQFWVETLYRRGRPDLQMTNLVLEFLPKFLQSPRPHHRQIGLSLAGSSVLTNYSLATWILPLLEDPEVGIQRRASFTLRWNLPQDTVLQSNLVEILARKLRSPDREQIKIGLSILRFGIAPHEELHSSVKALLRHPDSELREAAASYLIEISLQPGLPPQKAILQLTAGLEDAGFKRWIRDDVVARLWRQTKEDPVAQSNLVVQALEILREPDMEPRKFALALLSKGVWTDPAVVSGLSPMLNDSDPEIRQLAAVGLVKHATNDAVMQSNLTSVLIQSLNLEAAREPSMISALWLVNQVNRNKVVGKIVLKTALIGLVSDDAAVRARAAEILPQIAWLAKESGRDEIENAILKMAADPDSEVAKQVPPTARQFHLVLDGSEISETMSRALARSLVHEDPEIRRETLLAVSEFYRSNIMRQTPLPGGGWRKIYGPPIHLPPELREAVVACLNDEQRQLHIVAAALLDRDAELSAQHRETISDVMLQHFASTNSHLVPSLSTLVELSAVRSQELVDLMLERYASTNATDRYQAFMPLQTVAVSALDNASRDRLLKFWRQELRGPNPDRCLEALGLTTGDAQSMKIPIRILAEEDEDYVAPLLPMFRSAHPHVRETACRAILQNLPREPAMIRPLPSLCEELATDTWPQVSVAALNLLHRIAESASYTDADPVFLEARDRWQRILKTAPLLTRARLITLVSGHPDDVEAILTPILTEANPILRAQALRKMKRHGAYLPPELLEDPDPTVRAEAIAPEPLPPGNRSVKAWLMMFRSEDASQRFQGALGLSRMAYGRIITNQSLVDEVFKELLENEQAQTVEQIRQLNRGIVQLIRSQAEESRRKKFQAYLRKALHQANPYGRAAAWGLLLELNSRQQLSREGPAQEALDERPGLLLEDAQSTNVTVRVTALQCLHMLWNDPKGARGAFTNIGPEQFRVVLDALQSPEPIVACLAAEILAGDQNEPTALGRQLIQEERLAEQAWASLSSAFANCPTHFRTWLARSAAVLAAARPDPAMLKQAVSALREISPYSVSGPARNAILDVCIYDIPKMPDISALWPIALGGRHESARQLVLTSLLELLQNDPAAMGRSLMNEMKNSVQRMGLSYPEELQPWIRSALPLLAESQMEPFEASSLGQLMATVLAAAPNSDLPSDVEGWMSLKSEAGDPTERLQAMTVLSRLPPPSPRSHQAFLPGAKNLAETLTRDTNEAVRAAAFTGLAMLSSADRSFTVDPALLKAGLMDARTEVKAAALLLTSRLTDQPNMQTKLFDLADEFLLALPFLDPDQSRSIYRLSDNVQNMAAHAEDPEAVLKAMSSLRERAAEAFRFEERAFWFKLLGQVQLGRRQPEEAAPSFEQAARFVSSPYERKQLEALAIKARFEAGDRGLVLDESTLQNGGEILRRLKVLSDDGDWKVLLSAARQLLARSGLPFAPRSLILDLVKKTLAREGQEEAWEPFLKQEASQRPEDVDVLRSLAEWQAKLGHLEKAIATHEQAVRASQGSYSMEALGKLCQKTDQMERFEKLCRAILQTHPNSFAACQALVDYYVNKKRLEDARGVVTKFQESLDKSAATNYWRQSNLVDLFEMIRNYDDAIAMQKQIITVSQQGGRDTTYMKRRLVELLRLAGHTNELAKLSEDSSGYAWPVLEQTLRDQVEARQYEHARATAERLLALPLTKSQRDTVWGTLFRDLMFGNGSESLLRVLEEMRIQQPKEAFLPATLGRYYSIKLDWAKAAELMEQAQRLDTHDVRMARELAQYYLRLGQASRAIDLVQSFTPSGGGTMPDQERLLSEAYAALGDTNHVQQMASQLRARIKAAPLQTHSYLQHNLAWIESTLGHHDIAVDLISEAMADRQAGHSQEYDFHFLAAEYEKAGNADQAIATYQRYLQQEPTASHTHIQLAKLYRRLGRTNEAASSFSASQESFRQRISDGQASANDLNHLAWFYVENEILAPEAVRLARQAVALAPKNFDYADTLGWALLLQGDTEMALFQFTDRLTNAATEVRLLQSGWQAVNALVASASSTSWFADFVQTMKGALPKKPINQAWFTLVQAHFEEQHGEATRAAHFRASAGCPRENQWLFLGPFSCEGMAPYTRPYVPEEVVEIDQRTTYQGRMGAIRWEPRDDGRPDGLIELDRLFPGVEEAVAYAWIPLDCEREQEAVIHLGSDDQAQLWCNGQLAWHYPKPRSFGLDQDNVPVTLRQGRNSILIKIHNQGLHWKFCLRLTDPNGDPIPGLRFQSGAAHDSR